MKLSNISEYSLKAKKCVERVLIQFLSVDTMIKILVYMGSFHHRECRCKWKVFETMVVKIENDLRKFWG